jgi:hypothetical protein
MGASPGRALPAASDVGVHVVEAHGDGALLGIETAGRKRCAVRPGANGFLDPDELVELAAIPVLPHLKEAVDRIARVGAETGVGHVFGNLERPVRQVRRETRVQNAWRLGNCRGRIRLRQGRIGVGRWGFDRIGLVHVEANVLFGLAEFRPGRSVGVDDAPAQQIADPLTRHWSIGTKHVVEGMIFAHDDDHVLDGRSR